MTRHDTDPSDVITRTGPYRDHGDPELGGHTTSGGRVYGITTWTYTDCERYGCPVVTVIDPEDEGKVGLLTLAYCSEKAPEVEIQEAMQAALRALTKPAPEDPDEPIGLGAVVVDRDGQHWTRANGEGEWFSEDGRDIMTSGQWAEVHAVAIVHPGVTPETPTPDADVPLCFSRGPRIGDEGMPYCKRPKGHRGMHRPALDDGWEYGMAWNGFPDTEPEPTP